MDKRYKKLMLDQVDDSLKQFKSLATVDRPAKGWIKAIRVAIGMTGPQLAVRLGISAPGVFAMETSEANNKITLNALNRAAEALDCKVVYALVPNSSLNKFVDAQAHRKTEALVKPVAHTMKLEKQLPKRNALERETNRIARELAENLSSTLWDE